MKRRGSVRTALLALASATLLTGCAASVTFTSPDGLTQGVRDKSWKTPSFVDSALYPVGTQSGKLLVNDFDAVASGTSLQLVASWLDPLTASTYRGYARLYEQDAGWSGLGSLGFGQIAIDGTQSFTSLSVAADADGFFMANLFAGTPSDGASAGYDDGEWTLATNNTGLAQIPSGAGATVSAMDDQGRGYVFFSNVTAVWQSAWSIDDANGLDPTLNQVSATAPPAGSSITARFDGSSHVCVTYESATSELLAGCEDVSGAGPFDFASIEAQTLATDVAGHDTATDSEGGVMAVYYTGSSDDYQVYAQLGSGGDFTAATPTRIDDQGDAYGAPWPSGTYAIPGAKPGVAYVGDGRYLAVWVGVNAAASPPATQLYSNLYDPSSGGWQGASAIDGTRDSFSATQGRPHAQGLTVFGNGDGNAGYALNKIHTSDDIGGTHDGGSEPDVYPEDAQVRVLEANRWQENTGWLGATTFYDFTCFNLLDSASPWLAATSSGAGTDCARRPVGVILPSGDTFVFFQAQDGAGSGLVPGNRRLGLAVFW
jgi:hypothetical protein